MHDKVLGFIRETSLHEGYFEHLSVDPVFGEARLNLLQPSPEPQYPDPELLLIFSGLRDCSVSVAAREPRGESVTRFECISEGGLYRATIAIGDPGLPNSTIRPTFSGLRYERSIATIPPSAP